MSKLTSTGLWAVGGFVLLIGAATVKVVDFDSAGWWGAGIGAALGILNLVLGGWITARALRNKDASPLGGLGGGFLARLLVLVVLTLVFQRVDAVNEAAFALVFMMFFFVFVALELVLVERATHRRATC